MNNGKKEFPINGLEQDCLSDFGNKYLAYIKNISGIKKYVKRRLNKRMRKFNKRECDIIDTAEYFNPET